MVRSLTSRDIKEIKYQCRMGYILPILLFIIGTPITLLICELNSNNLDSEQIILFSFALLSLFIGYKMNWKYILDIRNGVKQVETKIIQAKESKRSYEAGSGSLYFGQEMKGNDLYYIIVENIRYKVDSQIFSACSKGDEILFNYAPNSKYLIDFELKKTTRR